MGEATGVFRAAIDMAAAPQRGANSPFFLRYRYESGKAERATEDPGWGSFSLPTGEGRGGAPYFTMNLRPSLM
jgi:hypothetical protein